HSTYVTYVRCHDDIGWAVVPEDAGAVGLDAFAHRAFLNSYYTGEFAGSPARGARFQDNPVTGDARMSGAAASLVGIEAALKSGDEAALDEAIRRHLLLHAVALSYGGIPLLWMGDELGMTNDYSYRDIPEWTADNRWMHRPVMDWAAAEARNDKTAVSGRIYQELSRLIALRTSSRRFRADNHPTALTHDNEHVLVFRRDGLLGAANWSSTDQTFDYSLLETAGVREPLDLITGGTPGFHDGRVVVPALSMLWLVEGTP
ncbi:MAG: alpha-amylase, partial [Acidimicrobiia bacterium]|nr:alpha-amylase [Acidimicrobiia bacterium]